jgi:regulator of extracellular matrix RemA (YlzA/DUF370 family)
MLSSGGYRLINIGYNNVVEAGQVVAIVNPNSAPVKRLRETASKAGRLIDACQGHRTRSVIVTASNHVIESATEIKTLTERYNSSFSGHIVETLEKSLAKGQESFPQVQKPDSSPKKTVPKAPKRPKVDLG